MTDFERENILSFINFSSSKLLHGIYKYGRIYAAGNAVDWPDFKDQGVIAEKLSQCLSCSVQLRWARDFSASYFFLKNQQTKHPISTRTIFDDIVANNGRLRFHGSSYGL